MSTNSEYKSIRDTFTLPSRNTTVYILTKGLFFKELLPYTAKGKKRYCLVKYRLNKLETTIPCKKE